MKKIVFLIFPFLVFASQNLFAQAPETKEQIFITYEKAPEFPGGEKALYAYMEKNLQYPESLKKEKIEGTVFLSFIIDELGQLQNITLERGIHPLLDAEALRVVKAMPKWIPGRDKGQPIKMKFNFPIQFKL